MRIDDAEPKLLICADAGMRSGGVIAYKPLVDAAIAESAHPPAHVLVVIAAWIPGLRASPAATSTMKRYVPNTTAPTWRLNGGNPTSTVICSTPAAPLASPRACSAMSAVHDELKGQVPIVFATRKQSPLDGDAGAVAADM